MKILLINDYAMEGYGSELQVLALRDNLRRHGHDVRIFASSARLVNHGDVLADYQCLGTTSRLLTLLQTANFWAYWKLRKVLKKFKPDVVHVRMFLTQLSPLILLLLKDIPAIHHVGILRPVCPLNTKTLPDGSICRSNAGTVCYHNRCLPLRSILPQMLELWLWRKWRGSFDQVIATSQAVKDFLIADGIKHVNVLWNPVPERPPRQSLTDHPTVGYAGRLSVEKGVDTLLRAFKKVLTHIPDTRLTLIGEGKQRKYLEKLITELGISSHVTLTGYLPQPEMEIHLKAAWAQVVPSTWIEAFGNVTTEAMIRGTAVVASNIGGPGEIVQHGKTGILVPPKDVDALAKALKQILQNRNLAEQMGQAGREYALKHFNQKKYINKILRLYESLITSNDALKLGQ